MADSDSGEDYELVIERKPFSKSLREIIADQLSDLVKDDPYSTIKQLEINRWYYRYEKYLSFNDEEKNVLSTILKDDAYWDKNSINTSDANSIKLNRQKLGRAIIDSKVGDSYIFSDFGRYGVAYRCCFEEDMHNIFTRMYETAESKTLDNDYSIEKFITFVTNNKGPLKTFWTYMISQENPEILSRFKKLVGLSEVESLDANKQRVYEYGFRCAFREQSSEALKFFWDNLPEKNEDLLIEAALCSGQNGSYYYYDTNIVSWCLNNLSPVKKQELMAKNLQQKEYYSILNSLQDNYFFEDMKGVISCLQPKDLSTTKYAVLMSSIGEKIIKDPKQLTETGSNFLLFLWQLPGFEEHRQHYLDELGNRFATYSVLTDLVKSDVTEPVWEILKSASSDQFEKFMGCQEIHELCSSLCDSGKVQTLARLFSHFKNKTKVIQFLWDLDDDTRNKVQKFVETTKTKSIFTISSPTLNRSLDTLIQGLAAFESIHPEASTSSDTSMMVGDAPSITQGAGTRGSGDSISQFKL